MSITQEMLGKAQASVAFSTSSKNANILKIMKVFSKKREKGLDKLGNLC